MNELVVLGNQIVAGYEFTAIEGGFGEGKKCMLVRDIASIHDKEVKYINKLINSNIERFGDNDILDLKTGGFDEPVFKMKEQGIFTQAQIGNAKNIYLLSERGYAKLLKIMDDDKAWEIYDKFVDEYFTMRKIIREEIKPVKKLEERSNTEILKDNGLALNELFICMGLNIPKELIVATAIETTKRETGYDFNEVKLLINKQDEESYHTKSEICKRVGIKANKVNLALAVLGLQINGDSTVRPWILTELGKEYAVERAFIKNGHQGYEIKLKSNAEDYIKENINKIPVEWLK